MIIKQTTPISKYVDEESILVLTSIGGSPIHKGHIALLNDCKYRVASQLWKNSSIPYLYLLYNIKLLVIVNSDEFLERKHGFSFQDENERAYILDSIRPVDYTCVWHSDTQYIDEALLHFKPMFMCKGGDRSGPEFMPECELKAAEKIGCTILYGVGGAEKINSSSDLMKKCANHYLFDVNGSKWINDIERFTQDSFPKF